MAVDGIFLRALSRELNSALAGGRVEKVLETEKDEIVLVIRSLGESHRLVFSSSPAAPRVHITKVVKENPVKAPQLCMLLRKLLSGGKLVSVLQECNLERVLRFTFSCRNELGDTVELRIEAELMGRRSNIVCVNADGRIAECTRHVTDDMSSVRELLPGSTYLPPPEQEDRFDILTCCPETEGKVAADSPKTFASWAQNRYVGVSKQLAAEAAFRACGDTDAVCARLTGSELTACVSQLKTLALQAVDGVPEPTCVLNDDGEPKDIFPVRPLCYPADSLRSFATMSELCDFFYTERDRMERLRQRTQLLRKRLEVLIERCEKKLAAQNEELMNAENAEDYRLFGELLSAQAYALKRGMQSAELDNYYEPGTTVTVPLDVKLTPMENAQSYFRKYSKAKKAVGNLKREIAAGTEEHSYLESLMVSLDNCFGQSELAELREEMENAGYVKRPSGKRMKLQPSQPMEFLSSDGIKILVGRNNYQNDRLTLHTASRGDLWLHTKQIHGSHVIVCCYAPEVPERTLAEAAALAAWFSKGRNGSKVPVDYCPVKNVKKPSGSRPGMVIYEHYNTFMAEPEAAQSFIRNQEVG